MEWYNYNWAYRKKITIDYTKVSGDETDIPILILLASDSDLASKARSDGYDILFTEDDELTKIPHEIELYDNGTGRLIAWVNIPDLSSSVDTVIYMYYGNAGASDQQEKDATWDANYLAVYHMTTDPTSTIPDSSGNGNTMTDWKMESADLITDAQIGNGYNFDTGERLDSDYTITLQNHTIELWADPFDHSAWEVLFNFNTQGHADPPFRYYAIADADIMGYDGESGIAYFNGAGYINEYEWQHFAYTYDGTYLRGYYNGAIQGSPIARTLTSVTDDYEIASYKGGVEDYDGEMDEVRISNIARGANWLATQYTNTNDPANFYDVDTEVARPNIVMEKIMRGGMLQIAEGVR